MTASLTARLLATFLDELDEQVKAMNAELLALEHGPAEGAQVRPLFRIAHTLKGAARAAGVTAVEGACHELETRLASARSGVDPLKPHEVARLFTIADAFSDASRRLRSGTTLEGSPVARLAVELRRDAPRDAPERAAAEHAPVPVTPLPPRPPATTPTGMPASDAVIRVPAAQLDALMASLGELQGTNGHSAGLAADAELLRAGLEAWMSDVRRGGHGALPDAEFRRLQGIARGLTRLSERVVRDARARSLASRTVTDRARQLRMRPFADITDALPRAVRDVANALEKDVRLELHGLATEADRAVLDALREALLHLVRNAVDHGIELPGERQLRGKPMQGTVEVRAAVRGDRLQVTVRDDGAGIDTTALRLELTRAGRVVPRDDRQLSRGLLEGGISTRGEVTAISGRGVGLDLVRAAAERVNGTLDVSWEPGSGTTFVLECPISLARIRAVLVRIGDATMLVPTIHVIRILRVSREQVRRVGGRDVLPDGESSASPMVVVPMARLLGPPYPDIPPRAMMVVLVVQSAGSRVALAVDDVLGEEEMIARPIPPGFPISPHVAGAATPEAGRVALVVNVPSLVAQGVGYQGTGDLSGPDGNGAACPRRVLVVDDSITTLTLEQGVLEAAGFEVRTARDGAEAWGLLETHEVDLVVSDVDMPRMDGFTLCEAIRASPRLASLPVVLVTAEEAPESRARGLAAGADAYLGKSSLDHVTLLDVVRQLVGA